MLKKYIMVIATLLLTVNIATNANANWLNKSLNKLNKMGIVSNHSHSNNSPSRSEIAAALKQALEIGAENTVSRLGRINGFYKDSHVHIPLPSKLQKIKNILNRIGMGGQLNKLELQMNRAAELATPKAKRLFLKAIKEMTISDVYKIYKGPDDAATQYFKKKMGKELKEEMRPIVERSLRKVKAVQTYNSIVQRYNSLPFGKRVNLNLTDYVLNKAEDGIFYYIAQEEKAIRKNPAKRVTDLLKKVFGYR